jgi:serine protease
MAGTIAADTGNGIGIAGVAPGATILPVRILDSSGESDKPSVVADGIRWAVAHGADVVNLSLAEDEQGGGSQSGDLLSDKDIEDAIVYATSRGVAAVIAAGNTDGGGRPRTSYVAGAPGAIVVGASTIDDKRAAYSNYGPGLDVLAPGGGSGIDPSFSHGCTQTNSVIGLYWDPRTRHSDYAGACGTSVAVAHVSGVVALLMAEGYSAAGAVLRIEQTTVDLAAPGKDSQTGWGRLDAARAVGPGPALHGPAGDPRHIRIAVGGAGATAAAVVSASPASPPASALAITPRGRGRGVAVAVAFVLAVAVAGARGVLTRARGG